MNSIKHRFTLDMHSTQSQISIPASLYDTARTLYVNFTDGGNPYHILEGCLALLTIARPSGSIVSETCTIEKNTTVVYPFLQNKNTAAEEGIHNCEITLYGEDGEKIASPKFSIVVSERVIRRDDDTGLDEGAIGLIDNMVKEEQARRTAEEQRATAEEQRATAEEQRATAENARATAEEQRATAENARATAEEQRATAEEQRATAEEQRGEKFNSWEGMLRKWRYTPQMFGAKGDGITDDTRAIKNAIAELEHGDTLYFPKGSYLVSEPFTFDKGIIIQGAGIDFTNICVENEAQINGYVFSFTEPQNGGGICDLTIKNSIDGIHSNASGLYIGAATERLASNFKCHHVKIIYMVNGLFYDKLWEAYFDHIFIMNCSDTGFRIYGADTEFSNMNISKCKCGMHIGAGTTKICNLKIDNCNTGSINEYALRIYGHGAQITNAEVQFCYPSGVIVTSPNNVLDLRLDGIGMDALYNFREAGYYFRGFDNCKNNNIKLAIITHDNNETLDYIHDDSHLFEYNTLEITGDANIPLWKSPKKCYRDLTDNVYNEKNLSELKSGNYLVECTYSADTNTVESDETQIGIRLMQYLHPNIESNLYSAYVKVITDKPMANPLFWYADNIGANNKCIKLKERQFGAKYETTFALYSEKTTNVVQALYLRSTENEKFKLYDIKFAIFGEIVDYKYMESCFRY